jgi:hypothetical protein
MRYAISMSAGFVGAMFAHYGLAALGAPSAFVLGTSAAAAFSIAALVSYHLTKK